MVAERIREHITAGRCACDLMMRRIDDIDARIRELRAFRRTLHTHLAACDAALMEASEPPCPIIEALDGLHGASEARETR